MMEIPAFAARPLRPVLGLRTTQAPGSLEPLELSEVSRGSRTNVSMGGAIVAGGGYPAPIRRTASFAVILRGPTPVVNLVTGVPSRPLNPKLVSTRRRRR